MDIKKRQRYQQVQLAPAALCRVGPWGGEASPGAELLNAS